MRKTIAAAVGLALIAALPARAEMGEVRLGLQYGFIYLPIVIAQEEKLIEKHAKELGLPGLKVALHRFSGSAAMNEAILSNSIDFGAYGLPGLLIAWEKTKGRQAVKGLTGLARTAYAIVSNRAEIRTMKDFGAEDRIALPAANSPQALMLKMVAEQLYGPGQYTRLDRNMASMAHPDAVAALLSGRNTISGYFATPPFSQMLAKDSRIHVVATSREILGGKEATGAGLGGTSKFADANPKVTRAVVLGVEDGIKLIRNETRRAAEIYLAAEKSTLSNEEAQKLLLDGSTDYDIAPHGVVKYAEFMVKIGMLEKAPTDWKETFLAVLHDRNGD
jgi:NitT/TauT family transport system substrate-binding protein